jgi:two-component system, NarL family, nitrate/nitrite response regulator NarL
MAGATRIAVQSRRRLVRDALCAYLASRSEFTVVGQTASLETMLALCALRRPDVVLIDAEPAGTPTVAELRQLCASYPATQVVVAYTELHPQMLAGAIQAGVSALVPCAHGLASLVRTLRQYQPGAPPAHDGFTLTERELEVVSLLGAGHSVPRMAQLLRISPRTVENHKRRIYVKLGVGNQIRAVSQATSMGLIGPGTGDPGTGGVGGGGPVRPPDPVHPATAPLVLLCGEPGAELDRTAEALAGGGLPFRYAGAAPDPAGTGEGAAAPQPSAVVLVDPGPADWALVARLGAPCLVIFFGQPDLSEVADALLRGARSLVRGADVAVDLPAIVELVAHGYFAMPTEHVAELIGWLGPPGERPGIPELTSREADILGSIARGHTVRQTARALGIAVKTVENTQARLFRKLGARNRSGALTIAYRLGLVDPADRDAGGGGEPTPGGSGLAGGAGSAGLAGGAGSAGLAGGAGSAGLAGGAGRPAVP